MKKPTTNVSASILARLKNISEKDNLDFNFLLLRYIQERFLARLAVSKYVKKFILKGGFLLVAYNVAKARPTKDIDFLGVNVSSNRKELEHVIREIISLKMDDGINFVADSLKSEEIKEEAEYSGVRIKVTAKIGTAKNTIQLDLGFGDIVIPEPLSMDYPTLLNNKSAKILAYSKETIVAEKFEAIVKLTTFNSRMKDFFDIVFLANEFDYDGSILQSAISTTFKHRSTDLSAALEMLDSDFGDQPNFKSSWEVFKKRTKLSSETHFKDIFSEIRLFLEPVIAAEIDKKSMKDTWNNKLRKWE